jgi:hypothetical protein
VPGGGPSRLRAPGSAQRVVQFADGLFRRSSEQVSGGRFEDLASGLAVRGDPAEQVEVSGHNSLRADVEDA